MEYRSPLGYSFKLEQSLIASKEKEIKETPKKEEHFEHNNSGRKTPFYFNGNRNSQGYRNSQHESPRWSGSSNNWNSPNPRNSNGISQYYHPSMLEDPWEELEREMKTQET